MDVIIDRFEGDYAVVEIDVGKFVNMPKILVPNAHEGDVVHISVEHDKTKEREDKIEDLMNRLFQD